MGDVLEDKMEIGTKASLRRAAIDKAQSDFRQEYALHDKRKRELEFLEKGGNPLEFKVGEAASVSVQSISHTDVGIVRIENSCNQASFRFKRNNENELCNKNNNTGNNNDVLCKDQFYASEETGDSICDNKAHEDSTLKMAQIIEEKNKMNTRKSHWDFFLEEMAWLAKHFAQRRLWKITIASERSIQVTSQRSNRGASQTSNRVESSFRPARDYGNDVFEGNSEKTKMVEGNYRHGTIGSHQSILMGNWPASNLNVDSIPTRHLRTASRKGNSLKREKSLLPFECGKISANPNIREKRKNLMEGSYGHGTIESHQSVLIGNRPANNLSVVSIPTSCVRTASRQTKRLKGEIPLLPSECEEIYAKPIKKRDNSKRSLEGHSLPSNRSSGLFGQHDDAERPLMMNQSVNNIFDDIYMMDLELSNMYDSNELMSLTSSQDYGMNIDALEEMPIWQPDLRSPWSPFEDQALVVLVYDLGPHWELVSNAINSTSKYKHIFRNPIECYERHKNLMDEATGQRIQDSPFIQKGRARKYFQQMQKTMQVKTLECHFEKIISIGNMLQHDRRSQSDTQNLEQIAVHNSHVVALSQVYPNNLNGGFLTPLDLCDDEPAFNFDLTEDILDAFLARSMDDLSPSGLVNGSFFSEEPIDDRLSHVSSG